MAEEGASKSDGAGGAAAAAANGAPRVARKANPKAMFSHALKAAAAAAKATATKTSAIKAGAPKAGGGTRAASGRAYGGAAARPMAPKAGKAAAINSAEKLTMTLDDVIKTQSKGTGAATDGGRQTRGGLRQKGRMQNGKAAMGAKALTPKGKAQAKAKARMGPMMARTTRGMKARRGATAQSYNSWAGYGSGAAAKGGGKGGGYGYGKAAGKGAGGKNRSAQGGKAWGRERPQDFLSDRVPATRAPPQRAPVQRVARLPPLHFGDDRPSAPAKRTRDSWTAAPPAKRARMRETPADWEPSSAGRGGRGFRIRVGNVPRNLDCYDLREAFQDVGRVNGCDVEAGTAYVWFDREIDAKKAVQTFDRGELNGQTITVRML
mmetsp:Transcript_46743/g.111165  ORF Transcript_46743/g.111165 Transcript_46743/m.111165 type:complete len:378 (-) Transcript_46743:98-1231(-)